ncbi:hypothetical protein LXL04_034632 [Taraxacum kok-saghyz]
MAYFDDEYTWPQTYTSYDLQSYQNSVSFSGYKSYDVEAYDAYTVSPFQEPGFVEDFQNSLNYHHNSASCSSPVINYFAYNYVEPKSIEYEPVSCDTGYVSYHTQYSISYSKREPQFNEPEFDEYDPTPYGGGYDIVSVYGKPLPPSDQTCYPRSNPKTIEPKSKPVAHDPIPLVNPVPESQHEPVHVPLVDPEPEPVHVSVPTPEPLDSRKIRETDLEEWSDRDYGYEYDYPWPEYDHGYGIGVGYDYGYGKQVVVQVPPCEYDPEVVDFCESIFGSWPCLARIRRQQMDAKNNPGITSQQIGTLNSWEESARSIFGRPLTSYYR